MQCIRTVWSPFGADKWTLLPIVGKTDKMRDRHARITMWTLTEKLKTTEDNLLSDHRVGSPRPAHSLTHSNTQSNARAHNRCKKWCDRMGKNPQIYNNIGIGSVLPCTHNAYKTQDMFPLSRQFTIFNDKLWTESMRILIIIIIISRSEWCWSLVVCKHNEIACHRR